MVIDTQKKRLQKIPLFKNLEKKEIDFVLKNARIQSVKKGDFIFHKDEPGKKLFVVLEGMVKIRYADDSKRNKTLALLQKGEFFGEMAIIMDSGRSADAEAIVDTEVMLISKDGFMQLLGSRNFCLELLKVLCTRLEDADRQIENLTFKNLPGRVAEQIFLLADKYGTKEKEGIRIDIRLTHSDLAEMVGTNRESISKIISQFKSENSLAVIGNHLIISDPDKLGSWR